MATSYIPNHRYYFVIVCSGLNKEATAYQYYVTSPSSGCWECLDIVSEIQSALTAGLSNVACELVYLQNPEPAHYRIRFITLSAGTDTYINLLNPASGDSLLTLLGGVLQPESGQGAYAAIPIYYKVQGVQVVNGEIVRSSEFSNIATGVRPAI
jgi:hypothetical protein